MMKLKTLLKKWMAFMLTLSMLVCMLPAAGEVRAETVIEETTEVVETIQQSVEEPEAAEEPAPTEEPEATEEPVPTEEPEATEEPVLTEEPEATEEPVPTEEPEATEEPVPTEEPEATEEPVPTEEPEATEEPVLTEEPEATEEPVLTEEPEATEEPAPTEEPEATEEPVPTEEPEATEEPVPTEELEATEEPAPTEEPEATGEPVPTEEPVVPIVRFECEPEDVYILIQSLVVLDGSVSHTLEEQSMLLANVPEGETIIGDENGAEWYRIVEHAALEGQPACYALSEGDYFVSASREGYVGLVCEPVSICYNGAEEFCVELILTAHPMPTEEPEAAEEPEATEEPAPAESPAPEAEESAPAVQFVCAPEDVTLSVCSLVSLNEAVSHTAEELSSLLLTVPEGADVIAGEDGDAWYQIVTHAAVSGQPLCYLLPEGDYFVTAVREGYVSVQYAPVSVAYEGASVFDIQLTLTKLEEEVPEMPAECAVAFTGLPEGAQVTVMAGETAVSAGEDGTFRLLPGEYLYSISCEGYFAVENAVLIIEEGAAALAVETALLPRYEQVSVSFANVSDTEVLRVFSTDEAGEETEYLPDEAGVYLLTPGEYSYDVTEHASQRVETRSFAVDGSQASVEIAVEAFAPITVSVSFEKMPENLTLSVYTLAEDGSRAEVLPGEDGSYALVSGEYLYDASCEEYASVSGASFTVAQPESEGTTQQELVWLLSNERASVNRSEKVVLFGVRSSGGHEKISNDLAVLLDGLGVINAEYFYTGESAEYGYESIYYGEMDNDNVWFAVDMLLRHEEITFAEPEFLYYTTENIIEGVTNSWATGDQSYLTSQSFLKHQQLPSIWAKLEKQGTPPGQGTIVAVIDTGVDYTHPDLNDNMWVNTSEASGRTGVDDDGNGYVDDIYGYNFVSNKGDPKDDHGHGTHVAGIIAMEDNNSGGVGIAYASKIMAIKAGQATGSFASSAIAKAVLYAKANGADIINMSFGGYSASAVVESALKSAYGDCVLVAAAGNDETPTYMDVMYPAGYDCVLGVMATDHKGEELTDFSNYDTHGERFYELAAPGYGMYSTLPGGRYATWSGTSMATPVVSAAAAIIRSSKPDGSVYSNRYIVGQLVGASGNVASKYCKYTKEWYYYPSFDLLSALNYTPVPQLTVTGVQLFDSTEFSTVNNGDGVWQNGETIELGLEVTNRWGAAVNLTVTADSLTEAGDPGFVTFEDATSYIDAVGTYATANNGYVYEDGLLTGFTDPIRFTIDEDVANNVEIPINLHVTGYNGMDESDGNVYATDYTYVVTIENGSVISGILTEDTTLTNDRMWIIRGSVQVPEGITLTVEAGTHVHFERVYTGDANIDKGYFPYLQVLGSARFNGTLNQPITITTDSLLGIVGPKTVSSGGYYFLYYGLFSFVHPIDCTMQYVNIDGNHSGFDYDYNYSPYHSVVSFSEGSHLNIRSAQLNVLSSCSNSVLEDCLLAEYSGGSGAPNIAPSFSSVLLNKCAFETYIYDGSPRFSFTHCLYQNMISKGHTSTINKAEGTVNYNAILNPLSQNDVWYRPNARNGRDYSLSNNYWGTDNQAIIDEILVDSNDIVSYGTITYEPFLKSTDDLSSIYPFVLDAWVANADGDRIEYITPGETVTFHVLFNRDMNTSVQPEVAYGAASPYNDYRLSGNWISAREWTATQTINPLINYGAMHFYVEGAVAADDPWLVTATDTRLWFNIAYSGAEALVLQASASTEGITLTWTQDDFDTLAGYNVYRSQTLDDAGKLKNPVKINTTILPYEEMTYLDSNVEEGETYHYMFTVMQTDFTESDGSNISTCTALDMTPPVIVHTPVDSVVKGEAVPVSATVTDNVKVDSVTLYARMQGAQNWTAVGMTNTTGNLWYAAVSTDAAGTVEYYLAATDGVCTVFSGSAEEPHAVAVTAQAADLGDVNMDGTIDIMDLMMITRNIAGMSTLGVTQKLKADVNADGMVDIFDLMKVAQYVCGIITQL